MFAYGTLLLTLMEADTMVRESVAGGGFLTMLAVLVLPCVCSMGGLLIAAIIWRNNFRATHERWPREWNLDWRSGDGKAYAVDLGLTACYLILWLLTLSGGASTTEHQGWVIGFLLISNATTIPNFIPILRSTHRTPAEEHPLPWFIWAAAYAVLLVPTWIKGSDGVLFPASWAPASWDVSFFACLALMSYPLLNTIFHGLMGVASFSSKMNNISPRRRSSQTGDGQEQHNG